jgi:hypothetical protein
MSDQDAKKELEEVEIQPLGDEELDSVAGGLEVASESCCCTTGGGSCSNGSSLE